MADKYQWKEEVEIATGELITKVKELVKSGNVRRLIIKDMHGKTIVEIPLNAGIVIGGVVTFMSPVLAVLAAIAGVMARVKVEIIREKDRES